MQHKHKNPTPGLARTSVAVRVLAVAIVAAVLASVARAQPQAAPQDPEYIITRWETDDGLPDSSATCMAQDTIGYLWIGTFRGLARFDGIDFALFDPANTPALPRPEVVSLHTDRSGRLWVGTLGGLATFADGQWQRIDDPAVKDIQARSFAERANGDLLIADFTGHLFEFAEGKFRALPEPPGLRSRGYLVAVSESQRWWVAQTGFIGEWDGRQWVELIPTPKDHDAEVSCAPSRDGGVWVLVDRTLTRLRGGAVVSKLELATAPGGLWQLYEDSLGNVWISSYDSGVWRVAPSGEMRSWRTSNGLGHDAGRFVFEDRERTLWIGSSGGGLSRFRTRRFQSFTPPLGTTVSTVNSITAAQDGGIWFATFGQGLFRLDDAGIKPVRPESSSPDSLAYLQSVLMDSVGRCWLGTYAGDVLRFDESSAEWLRASIGGRNVAALFEDSKHRIWTGGNRAVAVHAEGVSREFGPDDGIRASDYRCIGEDSLGRIWVSDRATVLRLEGQRFVEVLSQDGLRIPGVVCMRAGSNGSMWLGTSRRGLLHHTDTRIVEIANDSWPAKGVFSILEDAEGFWWMSSECGVVRARRDDLEAVVSGTGSLSRVRLFDRRDGMLSSDCTSGQQPASVRDTRGRLWFATVKGITMVDPAALQVNDVATPAVISELVWQARSAPRGNADAVASRRTETYSGSTLVLPPGSRGIEIHYAGLSFVAPEKVRFQVRLSGVNPEWSNVGTRRAAFYDELAPGSYQFNVRASNDDGLWGPTASLTFDVRPFIWQTTWFRSATGILVVTLSVVMTAWIFRARHTRAREQLELKQHRQEMIHLTRVNMLGELSGALAHELSQPLTAILSNAQAAQRFLTQRPAETGEVAEILSDIVKENRRAGDIIFRLRQLLKKGEVSRQPLEADQIFDDVLRLVRGELINRNVAVHADVPSDLPLLHGDRVQIEQVILNLIVNAIDAMNATPELPAGSRALILRCRAESEALIRLSVVDTGPGVPAEQLPRLFEPFFTTKASGMGLGLPMCRTIVSAHGGRIWAENNSDRGATFHFTLPAFRDQPS